MANLIARTPLSAMAPVTHGAAMLSEASPGPITSIAPYAGREKKLSTALKTAHGIAFPAPNCITEKDGVRAIWSARSQAFLVGTSPAESLSAHAALTDQSDGWATLRLQGPACADVLARLLPLDLAPAQFAPGTCARSAVLHTMALIVRTAPDRFDLMVMRSFAATAWHEIEEAMRSVAARG